MVELEKIIIAAVARNGVIGAGNGLPWKLPEEYQRFLATIRGETVIWGRRTFELFSSPPPSAVNIILSRSRRNYENAVVVASLADAFAAAAAAGERALIAGGASVYRQALPYADRLYISWIDGEWAGDAFFPQIDFREWRIVERKRFSGYEFVMYRRMEPVNGSLQRRL
ncbi:MAG: dihydrofolate reductase [candidate division KSB1 bacterium]|nr:dihydrofolate reductase [candidate division KSB1 bacterium]